MPFDPKAKSTPFISVEGPDQQPPDRPAAPRRNFSVVSTPRPRDEYEEEIISMRREETALMTAIQSLRTEAERFVVWRRDMGEGTGANSWGEWQRLYTAHTHTQHCVAAAELKAIAEKKFPGQSQRLFDMIFKIASRFGEAITLQARKELGL
jgi:hypothetical protein